ncbi:alpha/beta-type small acid-soluble spore protein [Gehongia tenuis]|uniref:Alpha/beta-type small acid-soluble spore protein n=1 Tax=Gehongia tenuis TaxID=2763655 RepID=A0A926HP28_9FIRM|nr:alpha/beta-type small acid-soluble spore protein [Gehongia tenuis]MBC8530778.1 alpha/beta-type small acid-soluble spore protein [Gehongia tenuis]
MASSNNRVVVPEAKQALDKMKYEIAQEMGLQYNGYKGDLTSKQNGSVGGEMVRRMIEDYQNANK